MHTHLVGVYEAQHVVNDCEINTGKEYRNIASTVTVKATSRVCSLMSWALENSIKAEIDAWMAQRHFGSSAETKKV